MSEPTVPYRTRLGVEQTSREIAELLDRSIKEALAAKGLDPKSWGFTLFLFNYGEGGMLNYVSTAERADMLKLIREWLEYQEAGDPGTILPPTPGGQN